MRSAVAILYEGSYKKQENAFGRGDFVRRIVQKAGERGRLARFCTKDRTKSRRTRSAEAVLYEGSYKKQENAFDRSGFVRRIVQKAGERVRPWRFCTKNRTKSRRTRSAEAILYEGSYKKQGNAFGRGDFVRRIVQKAGERVRPWRFCTKDRTKSQR
jgi:hypothetical protein